jgi:SAM-dependent methyltransferase
MASNPPSTDPTPSQYSALNYDNPPSIRYLPTTAAYDLWAEHYDHDSNFLQALDTREMKTLFPQLLEALPPVTTQRKLVDLGCGTGRNTVALLGVEDAKVEAVDASPKMLDVARERIAKALKASGRDVGEVEFGVVDLLASREPPELVRGADAVISTLVLEHIPCDVFFGHVAQMLKPGGMLLMTNMHSEMGGISQAGFVDPKTGEKIRPTSYAHTVEETIKAAEQAGLEVVGEVSEKGVDESLVQALGPRSRKWVGIKCWYGGLFRKVG